MKNYFSAALVDIVILLRKNSEKLLFFICILSVAILVTVCASFCWDRPVWIASRLYSLVCGKKSSALFFISVIASVIIIGIPAIICSAVKKFSLCGPLIVLLKMCMTMCDIICVLRTEFWCSIFACLVFLAAEIVICTFLITLCFAISDKCCSVTDLKLLKISYSIELPLSVLIVVLACFQGIFIPFLLFNT